jgi:uncharacterized protein
MPDVTPSMAGPPKLGVGVLYNRAVERFLHSDLDALDFLEIIPDTFRTDHGMGHSPRFVELEDQVDVLDWVAPRRPLIAHSIGMSIGSAGLFDEDYLAELARWQKRYGFAWHSEHLSFSRIADGAGGDRHAGVALPLPCDEEALQLVAARVQRVKASVPVPFLLENNVYFAPVPEEDMREAEFLNRLTATSGCGLLLDVHNVYANARNHGHDARAFLGSLDLSRVVEVHVAGGSEIDGAYLDSHTGPCPDDVWALLEVVVPKAPNLRAVTFEFEESSYSLLQVHGLRAQLDRARAILAHSA